MSVLAIMEDANTTATTQLGPITALVIVDGSYQAIERPAQVWRLLSVLYLKHIHVGIDECSSDNGGCDQNCHNIPGSYYCTCNNGWMPSSNSKTCTGILRDLIMLHLLDIQIHHNINILYPAAILEVFTTQDTYVVTEGGTAVVNCSATGGVAPTNINFHTPTGVLLTDTGLLSSMVLSSHSVCGGLLYQAWRTLTISGAAFEDTGTYTCSAAVNGNITDTTGFYIFVEGTCMYIWEVYQACMGMGEGKI